MQIHSILLSVNYLLAIIYYLLIILLRSEGLNFYNSFFIIANKIKIAHNCSRKHLINQNQNRNFLSCYFVSSS